MTPQQRQARIQAFVAQYEQQYRRAPTVGDILRGSGVDVFADVRQAVDALVRQGRLTYVPGTGATSFKTQQVRSAAAARPAPAPAAGPPGSGAGATTARPSAHRPQPATAHIRGATHGGHPSPGSHVQQPMPATTTASVPAAGPFTAGHGLPNAVYALFDRQPLSLALLFAGVAIGLVIATFRGPTGLRSTPALAIGPIEVPIATLAIVAVITALGYAIGRASERLSGWSWRDLAAAAGFGAIGGAAAGMWSWALPWIEAILSPIDPTGIPAILVGIVGGARFLPLLLPAAWARRPGAVVIGTVVGRSIESMIVGSVPMALDMLQWLVMAAPVEVWFISQGDERTRRGLVVGAFMAVVGALAATYLTVPGSYTGNEWLAEAIRYAMGATAAAWFIALLDRRGLAPSAGGTPGRSGGFTV